MRSFVLAAMAAIVFAAQPLFAGALTQVDLEPIDHMDASLTIVSPDGTETSYSPADLEAFTTYTMTTTTPWRDEPATFEGVLLSEVLAAHGLDAADAIVVTAENDYRTEMTRALLESVDILLATRVNGAAHTRRARGPIQFVIEHDSYSASNLTSESNFVWMAARIEADK